MSPVIFDSGEKDDRQHPSDILHDAQRMARCRAAAPKSTSFSVDVRRSRPISARNGCMSAGSPVYT